MYNGHTISIVVPCLNEEHGIRALLGRIPSYIDEVVVIDNGSTDATAAVAQSLGARVVHEAQPGYGRAYKAGIPAASSEIIITMDGDGSYPADQCELLLKPLTDGEAQFISGSRFPLTEAGSMNRLNHIGNTALTLCANILFWQHLRDSQSGMWAFPKTLYTQIVPTSNGMAFSQELKLNAIRAGITFREVPISYYPRIGTTKLSWVKDGAVNLASLFTLRLCTPKPKKNSQSSPTIS
jgi:glycosyltransferase involved in cell wall biosynthesis